MENNSPKNKYTMYDFISHENSIYSILQRYAGIEEMSYKGIFDWFRTTFCKDSFGINSKSNQYNKMFESLMDDLKKSTRIVKEDDGIVPMSAEEQDRVLQRLQSIDPNKRELPTIAQYIKLVEDTNFKGAYYTPDGEVNPYYDALNRILTEVAVKHGNRERISSASNVILNVLAVNEARQNIRHMHMEPELEAQELEKIKCISNILSNSGRKQKYDQILSRYYDELREHNEKIVLKLKCESKREDFIESSLDGTMSATEKIIAKEDGVDKAIFKKTPSKKPKPGSFEWRIKLAKNPEVILDEVAEYSKNGIENQRVVAIDYGKFEYDTLFQPNGKPTFSSDIMHIVGVTRLGRDGIKNYFVLMPLDDMKLKKESELTENDKKIPLIEKDEGQKNREVIIRGSEDFEKYVFVQGEKIPKEQRDFLATVALSDLVLERAIKDNARFIGHVEKTPKGLKVDATSSRHIDDVEAAVYAQNNPGYYGKKKCDSLGEILENSNLILAQMKNVKKLYPGKHYSNYTVVNENGDRIITEPNEGDAR